MDGIHTSKERRHLVVISCSLHYVNNLVFQCTCTYRYGQCSVYQNDGMMVCQHMVLFEI